MDAFGEQLLEIFRRKVKKKYRDVVRPEGRLQADLGMDSLGVLSAMTIAEEELALTIFPLQADVGEIRTVPTCI
jgi:acyl carrier protein